jgi:hypothetical protein
VSFLDGHIFVERLRVWADNDDYITQVNDRGMPYKLAHNRFSHLTLDEFHRHYRLGACFSPSSRDMMRCDARLRRSHGEV